MDCARRRLSHVDETQTTSAKSSKQSETTAFAVLAESWQRVEYALAPAWPAAVSG
jgi:hypothetical protein